MSTTQQLFRPLVTFLVTVLTFGFIFVLLSVVLMEFTPFEGVFFTFMVAFLAGATTGFFVTALRSSLYPRLMIPLYCLLLFVLMGGVTVGLALWQGLDDPWFRLTYSLIMAVGSTSGAFFGVALLQYFKNPANKSTKTSV
ncbi:hypothetical protein Pla110_12640 [Polystyrenella longa]|uniref:TIGR04086 family membrane protein n=1 Tax=Polystyrenella longa TaxID=2528007 RepID=A0A518CJZ4_9PLAN|nr:hypothetical protein [Polystyrenella longa]QDU79553.1 hypothetical protein Pla110_12640 [Polystyrenella longa]